MKKRKPAVLDREPTASGGKAIVNEPSSDSKNLARLSLTEKHKLFKEQMYQGGVEQLLRKRLKKKK